MKRYICIHGHFYQPPRENPWLEEVEREDSAYPYHDWNDRITAECYGPNTASRILGTHGSIEKIVNNFSRISFNFGPTLLSWLELKKPDVYQGILEADRLSQKRFSGHGSALAQVYNHLIMPLANSRDRETQVIWGIRDFESRFQRFPEGMWLPETAVNRATLDVLARQGIAFTIVAPHQAARIRRIGDRHWLDVGGGRIDPRRPYLCRLSSGLSIVLFFYDGPIAHDISFGNLLNDGVAFAERLIGVFSPDQDESQLVHIATDGESYGHHHRFGDMALAYCLDRIESKKMARLTVYGEYLEQEPPEYEVEIVENSSWSCAHGVERWRENCGCHSGMHPHWKQTWRKPLRKALDHLRNNLAALYERKMGALATDPWLVRNQYIEVVLNRDRTVVDGFLDHYLKNQATPQQKILALKLLEMQRHALLMFTSCGWFFDDIAGIESTQILLFAARAIQLARECGGKDLEGIIREELSKAPGNQPAFPEGRAVWDRSVQPQLTDLLRVGAHYAVLTLFQPPGERTEEEKLYCYRARQESLERFESGKERLLLGKVRLISDITRETMTACFAIVYFGGYNLAGGIRANDQSACAEPFIEQMAAAFNRVDVPEVIRLMDHQFGTHNYTLWHLFRDEQRSVLDTIMQSALANAETQYRQIYDQSYPIMQMMREFRLPLPRAIKTAGEYIVNVDLTKALAADPLDFDQLTRMVAEVQKCGIEIDRVTTNYVAEQAISRLVQRWAQDPGNGTHLQTIIRLFELLDPLPVSPDLGSAQNLFFHRGREWYAEMGESGRSEDQEDSLLIAWFERVAEYLKVAIR